MKNLSLFECMTINLALIELEDVYRKRAIEWFGSDDPECKEREKSWLDMAKRVDDLKKKFKAITDEQWIGALTFKGTNEL